MNNVHILEPDREFALLLQDELEYSGYTVRLYNHSRLFLMSISMENPDLAIVDMDHGHYDALRLLQQLRNSSYDLPIILWSWKSDHGNDPRAMAADHIVLKESDLTELKNRMRMALDSSWPSHPAEMTLG